MYPANGHFSVQTQQKVRLNASQHKEIFHGWTCSSSALEYISTYSLTARVASCMAFSNLCRKRKTLLNSSQCIQSLLPDKPNTSPDDNPTHLSLDQAPHDSTFNKYTAMPTCMQNRPREGKGGHFLIYHMPKQRKPPLKRLLLKEGSRQW